MKLISKTSFTFVLSVCLTISNAWATEYQFKFVVEPNTGLEVKPQTTPSERITINGQSLSAFNTSFSDPLGNENDKINFKVRTVQSKVRAEVLNRLELYAMPNGSVFVPKGWQLLKGEIGANGSVTYTFIPSKGEGYLSFYDASACVGCAQIAASVFFPEAYAEAKENDFTVYDSTNLPMETVRLRSDLIAYSVKQKEQRLDGVAYYNTEADSAFWNVEVSLPEKDRDLANPILNQFISLSKDR